MHGVKPSYLMVKAGTWGKDAVQLHSFFSWKDITVLRESPYAIGAPECTASEKYITGKIERTPEEVTAHPEYMCGSGTMSWNLITCNVLFYVNSIVHLVFIQKLKLINNSTILVN